MQLALLVKYEQIFADVPEAIQEYVRRIGRKLTLQLCTHFMYRKLQEDQQDIVGFWSKYFCHENFQFAKTVIDKLIELSQSHRLSVVHTQNLYMLIEAALDNSVPEELMPAPTNAALEQAFFKALLVANNYILAHQDEGLAETEKYLTANPSLRRVPILILANQLAYGDYEFALNDEVALTQLYKCVCFFQFAEQQYPKHLEQYLSEKGYKDWKEYVNVLSGIAFKAIKKGKGATFIHIPPEGKEEALNCCKQLCSKAIYDSTNDLDFIPLRNRPLYQWEENEFIVLSNLFLSEKLYQSIYFDFNAINDRFSHSDKVNEFKSKIGLEFSERTLLYEVLDRLFRDGVIKKTGSEIETIVGDGGCDYYVRSGNKVYLFESKDMLMRKDVKTSYDASLFMPFLYKRFVREDSKKKAVEQLLQNVQYVRDNRLEPNRTDGSKMTVYPIIVTHHRVFDTPAVNYVVNHWFQQKLQGMAIANPDRIKPVVIINIDTLIIMKDLCRQKSIVWKDLLDKYISAILRNQDDALRNSYLSFADKMHDSIFASHQFPKGTADFAKILFE